MKYEIKITKTLSNKLEKYYRTSLLSPHHPWVLSTFEAQVIGINEVFNEIFLNLEKNPFQYPKILEEIRVVSELFLPFNLIYFVKEEEVIIFEMLYSNELIEETC